MTLNSFGTTRDSVQVDVVEIGNDQLRVKLLTLGAIIHDVRLAGIDWPLTLGAKDVAAYEGPLSSFGSLMGPVINRIAGCTATIAGTEFTFEKHHSGNHTQHSGSTGIQKQVWALSDYGSDYAILSLDLPDGMGGFPGNRTMTVHYTVTGASLTMTVHATTDAPTIMNPANHSYWSLDPRAGFAGQVFDVHADRYSEPAETLMPTGRILPVEHSAYDFRGGMTLAGDDSQFFDVNLVLADTRRALTHVATLTGVKGVQMKISTTECGLQVYDCGTINAPDFDTHHGAPYGPYSGLAVEAQSWPGATTHSHFPSIELYPDETYQQITQWDFAAP